MSRIASHYIFCSPSEIKTRTVVEQDNDLRITGLFSLDANSVESAKTLFLDGIISAEIVSVKLNEGVDVLNSPDYQYYDISLQMPIIIKSSSKPLILDFGTTDLNEINTRIKAIIPLLDGFTSFEIIAACCYYPALAMGMPATLCINRNTQLILWEKTDLINKRLTAQTLIRKL